MIYMCAGKTKHIINGDLVELNAGELLLLNQSATHEVCRAEEGDVAVNFIVLPQFFTETLSDIGEEETPLRRFLVDCLCEQNSLPGYLHFRVSNIKPIQNLVENLLWSLLEETASRRKVRQMTMSVLMLQLAAHTDALSVPSKEDAAVFQVLHYAESAYRDGSLTEIAEKLGFDICWLSREIKRKTGKTYTQIVQEKRMAQAAFLLKNTNINVAEIAVSVGYDNISYFHRLFAASFGCSPKKYRDQ
jgi:AraC-like DNA-binding protein